MNLPRHQRSRPSFSETFERGAGETIAAMDRDGHDIPSQTPSIPLRLKRVGVRRRAIPIVLADPLGGSEPVRLSCSVDAHLSVGADQRGIHVSRIGDLLARQSGQTYPSLQEYAVQLNQSIRAGQHCDSADVSVEGVFTYLEDIHGVKAKSSLEHLDLFAQARFLAGRLSVSSGVGFNHITACPCVQETYRNSFAESRPPSVKSRGVMIPLLTHTQRCRTRVLLSDLTESPALSKLLVVIDENVVRSQNTLPREFELLNVHRAHARPQFLEDAIRELMLGLHQVVRESSPAATILIKSVSMESIHDFDMEGEIEFTVKELDRIFASKKSKTAAVQQIRATSTGLNGFHKNGNGAAPGVQKAGRKKPGKPSPIKRSPQAHSRRS